MTIWLSDHDKEALSLSRGVCGRICVDGKRVIYRCDGFTNEIELDDKKSAEEFVNKIKELLRHDF